MCWTMTGLPSSAINDARSYFAVRLLNPPELTTSTPKSPGSADTSTVDRSLGAQTIQRYNLFPSATINGAAAAGFSSGDGLALMERMADEKRL